MWDLIITLVTTMLVTQSLVMISTIVSRKRFHLTLNTSTRLLRWTCKQNSQCCIAGTGVGKSLFMCHMGNSCIEQGKNVLYVTLEMSEERIAERIDANMLDVSIQDLKDLSKKMYTSRIEKIKNKVDGRLIIKEYPTASVIRVTLEH